MQSSACLSKQNAFFFFEHDYHAHGPKCAEFLRIQTINELNAWAFSFV